MMHAEAKNPNCAYMWMEHSLNPKLQGDLAAWFGSVPVVPAACTDGSGMQTAEGCAANGSEYFDRIKFWKTPVAACPSGDCVPYRQWVEDYIAIIGNN